MNRIDIFECSGVPACGKSTLTEKIIINLKKEGAPVVGLSSFSRLIHKQWRYRVYKEFVSSFKKYSCFINALNVVASKHKDVSEYGLKYLLVLYTLPDLITLIKPHAIIILEEGFVQNITSLYHTFIIDENDSEVIDLIELIKKKFNIQVIDCRVTIGTAVKRLRDRKIGGRFNTIQNDEELKQALEIKQKNIDFVEKHFPRVLTIDTDKETTELENVSQKIIKHICGRKE